MPDIHIRLTQEQLVQIDALAKLKGVTRTALLTDRWPLPPSGDARRQRKDKAD